jgi:hypothetical protein
MAHRKSSCLLFVVFWFLLAEVVSVPQPMTPGVASPRTQVGGTRA